jgi:hypothetical protein
VLEVLRFLYQREPVPFQTLDFMHGTQQRAHADTLHFNSLPPKYMCGVWIALEDVGPDNGPIFYCRGSHHLPEVGLIELGRTTHNFEMSEYENYQEHLMAAVGCERLEFHARKGDALVWASNIVHGGTPIKRPGSTRRSQVTHYFFEGSIYYTPVRSDMLRGELYIRHGITNIQSGALAPQTLNGQETQMVVMGNRRTRLLVNPRRAERLFASMSNAVRGFPLQRARIAMPLVHRGRAKMQRMRLRRAGREVKGEPTARHAKPKR